MHRYAKNVTDVMEIFINYYIDYGNMSSLFDNENERFLFRMMDYADKKIAEHLVSATYILFSLPTDNNEIKNTKFSRRSINTVETSQLVIGTKSNR